MQNLANARRRPAAPSGWGIVYLPAPSAYISKIRSDTGACIGLICRFTYARLPSGAGIATLSQPYTRPPVT